MQNKREILQKALENINHPLSEITRRTTYRGHSPGVKPATGIKLNLPKTSTMAAKMEKVLRRQKANEANEQSGHWS